MRVDVQYSAMFKRLIVSKTIRQRVSWVIAAVLILPFILFFHATGRAPTRGQGGTAGMLFGQDIPWEMFQVHRLWVQRQWENRLGDVPETFASFLTQATWDRLTFLEEAKRRRLRVDDTALAAVIAKSPAFQEHGRFLPERYTRYLRAVNMGASTFEALLRDDLLVQQLIEQVKTPVSVSDQDVRQAYQHKYERLRALLFWFDPASFTTQVAAAVTEADVRAFYDAHAETFRVPEQIVFEYAGASRQALAPLVTVKDEDLEAFYGDHTDRFKQEDGTIKPLTDVRERVREQAVEERVQKQLTVLGLDLQDDLDAKRAFDEMVKTRALTRQTAGPIAIGGVPLPEGVEPRLIQEVAKLREGQLSGVIQTDNGVYVARATQRIPSRIPPLEEVREHARRQLIEERTRAAAQTAAKAFHASLKEQLAKGVRFEEAMLALKHAPATTVSFAHAEPIEPLGMVSVVNDTAFQTPLGTLTGVLDTPHGFVVLRPEARLPADPAGFDAEASTLRQETLTQRQSETLEKWLKSLRTRAKLQSFVD